MNLSKTAEKSSSSPCAVSVLVAVGNAFCVTYVLNLDELIRSPSPPRINFSLRLSVCLSVSPLEKHRFSTKELKVGYPRGVICPSSVPTKYIFPCAILYKTQSA